MHTFKNVRVLLSRNSSDDVRLTQDGFVMAISFPTRIVKILRRLLWRTVDRFLKEIQRLGLKLERIPGTIPERLLVENGMKISKKNSERIPVENIR